MKKTILLFTVVLSSFMTTVSAQTTLDVPAVGTASRITLSGFTANWTAVANATSYSINVYDGASALVTGSPKTVTGASSATLAITGMLLPNTTYTFTVTAIGDGVTYLSSAASASSASFTTATSTGTYTLQYAASDAATLLADLKGGAADIYELTTSGGAYTFVTTLANNAILTRNTTVRAAAGLSAKPVLKLNSTATGTTANIFYTATTGLTLKFDGLEFDGVNPGSGGTQPMAIYDSSIGSNNTKIYVTNCYFHDLKNASGNGVVRMNAVSGTQTLDIQGCTFNACGGRILYINGSGTSPTTTVNLKNNTFSNTVTLSSRNNVIYNNVANPGITTIDHCTFYKVADAAVSSGVLRITGTNGAITFKNSIFVTVPTALPTATVDYCYVAGLTTAPTGATNTFVTTPAFTNATTLDFSLTNKSSFVCADASIAGNTTYYSALPKLTTPTVGAASSIGTNGFTANWSAVANASGGYTIKVYKGLTLSSTTTIAGQATTSIPITGLQTGTTYTYTVTALGDAINYDSSVESSVSASFTTLGLVAPTVGVAGDITSTSFTANWTTVANASSYNILVYLTTNLVSTTNIIGQTSSSVSITGLAMGTTYTYKVAAIGDGVTYINSDPSSSSAVVKTLAVSVSALSQNFSDGTWGAVTIASPALGTYPVFSANGWDLTHAQVKLNASVGIKGESHSNVLMMDKTTNSGVLLTPVVTSASEIEIHSSATAGRQYLIQSSIDGGTTWLPVGPGNTGTAGTYFNNSASLEQIDIIPTGGLTNAQYKITDPSAGAYTFYAIISRTSVTPTTTVLSAPTGSIASSSPSSTGFTANWTNTVTNATGYKVNVYSNKLKTLITSVTVSDPNALTLAVTGLQADSTYIYGVVGLGDNITYSDGYILMGTSSVITNLAAPVASSASNILTTGFTANWASVNNASSYDVRVYDAALAQVGTTTNVLAGTFSLDVTGLNSNSIYTYTVTAKGNAVSHFDSAPSAPMEVSTTVTGLNSLNANSFITSLGKTIICSEIGNLVIYNVQGAKVLEAARVSKLSTNLSSGLYMVSFTTQNGKVINTKLIFK